LLDYLIGWPTAYLDEMAWFVFDELGVIAGLSTTHNILVRARWSRKTSRNCALERSEPLRALGKDGRLYGTQASSSSLTSQRRTRGVVRSSQVLDQEKRDVNGGLWGFWRLLDLCGESGRRER
jgi:hypothetical protein